MTVSAAPPCAGPTCFYSEDLKSSVVLSSFSQVRFSALTRTARCASPREVRVGALTQLGSLAQFMAASNGGLGGAPTSGTPTSAISYGLQVGFGRGVASDIEAPNVFANLACSG